MTFNDFLCYVLFYNVIIHRKFHQNRFLNESTNKNLAKFPEISSFVVIFRRAYVLKDYVMDHNIFMTCTAVLVILKLP